MQDAVTVLGDTAGSLGSNLAIIVAAVALALITLAMTLPKVFNSMKTDGLNSNVLTRLQAIEEKSAKQDEKIHRHAVRITKLSMLLLKFHGLLVRNNVPIPQDMIDEMVELTKNIEEEDA